ncbi:hypothetical protein [Glycomyces buryatensis]|uniref:Uncharacterized protein n=1 Tax=Glycomyces buryatensis TaxID=2570927 RepID=A0A4S8QEH6_9ACTN|nr:hypothetical protein [Glycomyces buryatensis]THV43027.1 hypothetical protein FAB82_03470 [Glycomyces buryatensis]
MAPQSQNSQPSGPFTLLGEGQQGRAVKIVLPAGVATLAGFAGPQPAPQVSTRPRNVVERLVQHGIIPVGEPFWFAYLNVITGSPIHPWALANPNRCRATFVNDPVNCLEWEVDHQRYSATGLALDLKEEATGKRPRSLAGPQFWVNRAGQNLVEIAKQHGVWP